MDDLKLYFVRIAQLVVIKLAGKKRLGAQVDSRSRACRRRS